MSKHIIEIDDKDKEICKQYIDGKLGDELGDYVNITELAEAIANATPYNEHEKEDLISRSGLKATIIEPLNVNDAGKNEWYAGYYTAKNEDVMTIGYAPPVSDRYDEGYARGYLDGSTGADWKGEEE